MYIPKIFHMIWVGPNPLPESHKEFIKGWLELHPGWKLMFWDNKNVPKLVNQKIYDDMHNWSGKSNVIRYEVLYHYGGIYLDTDTECLKNIEPLIGGAKLIAILGNHGKIQSAVLGCSKKHSAYKKIVNDMQTFVKKRGLNRREKYSPSGIGTRYIHDILMASSDLLVLNEKDYSIVCNPTEVTDSTYIIHHEEKSWKQDWGVI